MYTEGQRELAKLERIRDTLANAKQVLYGEHQEMPRDEVYMCALVSIAGSLAEIAETLDMMYTTGVG